MDADVIHPSVCLHKLWILIHFKVICIESILVCMCVILYTICACYMDYSEL